MSSKLYLQLLSVFLVVVVLISFSACGKTTPSADDTSKIPSNTENEKTSSNTELGGQDSTDSTILKGTYKVPMEDIYIDVPQYQEIEEGLTEVFIEKGVKYVAITANWKAEANDLEDAHEKCFEKFKNNMTNYQGGINGISITKSETKTINDIEMTRFEGKINYGTDTKKDGYAIGYTFIMNRIPCEIIGSVIEEGQSSSVIKEIASIIDSMALTIRDSE